nr:LOW QUALITY PROTEIN: DNA repair protein RAD50-like [Lepeophtheirus salmonis]
MSQIEKLQIQGIRSFGPRDEEKSRIDFVSNGESMPLTLILGQNGCGKTTIIECLRYITTGDCPPGSHGGRSFVHDPKMARESKVIGHVKLQFKGLDGRFYIISRTIEAAQKIKTLTIKTLDAVITRRGMNGEPNSSISGKCSDINAQMSIHLGVSKAILNYVIFCHQEDSNWPLDEGSKVKDKFDEIFASAKYKDCLKKIKDVRSKHMEQHRIESSELKYLVEDKELVNEKRAEKARKENAKEVMENDLAELESKMKPIENELRDIRKIKENFVDIEKDITSAEKNLEHCRQESTHLEKTLEFIIEDTTSDEEIGKMKDELEEECEKKKTEILGLKKRSGLSCQYRESQLNYIRNKKKFCSFVKSSEGEEFDLPNISDENDPLERDNVMKHTTDKIKTLSSKFSSDLKALDSKLDGKNQELSEVEIKKAQLEEQKKQKQLSLIKAKRESAILRKKLSELEGSSDEIKAITRRLEAKRKEYARESETIDLKELTEKIKRNKIKRSELNTKESDLKEERSILEEQKQFLSEIEIKNSYLEEKSKQSDKILAKRKVELKDIFKNIPKAQVLKDKFNELYESLSQKSKSHLHDESKYKSDISNMKESRKKIIADIEIKEKRVKDFRKRMSDMAIIDSEEAVSFDRSSSFEENDPFEKELELSKLEVENTRSEVQVKEANIFTYKEFIERLKETDSPCCPTCSRSFHKKEEVKELISDLEMEIKRIPNKVKSIKTKLNKAESKRDTLIDLLPEKRQCDELFDEISQKKTELTRIEKKIKEYEEKLSKIEDTRDVISMEMSTCEDLRDDIQLIDRLDIDKRKLQEDILDIKSNLGTEISSSRDYKVVKEEEESVSDELNKIRTLIEGDQATEMRQQKLLNGLTQEINSLTEQKLKIEAQQQERSNIEARRDEFEVNISEFEKELGELTDSKLKPIEDELLQLQEERNNLNKEKTKLQDSINKKMDKIKHFSNQLHSLHRIILEYEDSDSEDKFKRYIENQEKLSKVKESNEAKELTEKNIFEMDSYVSNQSSRKRAIDDNLRLRKYRVDEVKHLQNANQLKEKMKSLNLDSYAQKEAKLLEQRNTLETNFNVKRGRLEELKRVLGDLNRELGTAKFKNAEKRYREKHVLHQCRDHVISDLNKYYVALDWAIMKFHHERMQVINKIIRELWRATYKGNDIDYIEIKTDDAETLSSGADKRKTHNYRVMMVKNDTDLDMRGRCSAGQKVLASLIIRLALAETFSANCGIIALDEPTTNLDRENICSLADALARIVQERSSRSNFQLIVITHDEDLIDQLGRVEKVDKYYKVSRNENGLSQIRKFNIHNLQAED